MLLNLTSGSLRMAKSTLFCELPMSSRPAQVSALASPGMAVHLRMCCVHMSG